MPVSLHLALSYSFWSLSTDCYKILNKQLTDENRHRQSPPTSRIIFNLYYTTWTMPLPLPDSTRRLTALQYFAAFPEMDLRTIFSLRDRQCEQEYRPEREYKPDYVGNSELTLSNRDYCQKLFSYRDVVSSWGMEILDIMEDERKNKMMLRIVGRPVFKEEFKDGRSRDWLIAMESVYTLNFDQSGEKIMHIMEFVDTKMHERFEKLHDRAVENMERVNAAEN